MLTDCIPTDIELTPSLQGYRPDPHFFLIEIRCCSQKWLNIGGSDISSLVVVIHIISTFDEKTGPFGRARLLNVPDTFLSVGRSSLKFDFANDAQRQNGRKSAMDRKT